MMKTKFLILQKLTMILSILFVLVCSFSEVQSQESVSPGIDDFIEVEQDPKVDLAKLQKLVVYPDLALKAEIEGRIIVRILVDTSGNVRKIVIEDSDNIILNDAAVDAVKKYGKFSPAIFKGKPITCWVSIPISFRIKNKKYNNEY